MIKDKIIKFIKELPTILKLKRQIKELKVESENKSEVIDNLEEHIKDISDSELLNIKTERLRASRDHWLEVVHELRNSNKRLREEIRELKNRRDNDN